MTQDDKLKITIRVADIPNFALNIKRDEEEFYRTAVRDINKLWSNWKAKQKDEDSNRIIAVIAIKFAKQFYEILAKMQESTENSDRLEAETKDVLENFEQQLDKILLDIRNINV